MGEESTMKSDSLAPCPECGAAIIVINTIGSNTKGSAKAPTSCSSRLSKNGRRCRGALRNRKRQRATWTNLKKPRQI